MKKEIDLVDMFQSKESHRLCDLEPDEDIIREERELEDNFRDTLMVMRRRHNA